METLSKEELIKKCAELEEEIKKYKEARCPSTCTIQAKADRYEEELTNLKDGIATIMEERDRYERALREISEMDCDLGCFKIAQQALGGK
jgi:chromosome segregation ATPase